MNLEELERDAIERAMRRADGNISRAAELLGITRYTLYRKLNK
jgi:transcriptional regulator of acetoin/glycerol metabolism